MHAVMLWQVTMSQLRQQKETEKALAEESAKKRELEAKRMVRQDMLDGLLTPDTLCNEALCHSNFPFPELQGNCMARSLCPTYRCSVVAEQSLLICAGD